MVRPGRRLQVENLLPVRLGPRRLPDGWMRCLHFSPSSSPDTYPEQVASRNGNGKAVTVSPANVLVMPPRRGAEFDADTPVDLVRHFIQYCTRYGAVVCDPCLPMRKVQTGREVRLRLSCFAAWRRCRRPPGGSA